MIERMSADDARILGLESAAVLGHTLKLVEIAPGSDGERIRCANLADRIGERIGGSPRARQRPVPTPLGIAPPAWVDHPDFDLGEHLVDETAGEALDAAALAVRTGELMAERLDHSRPLWAASLLPLEDGRAALVVRIHHAMADGISCLRLLEQLLWDQGGDAPARPFPSPSPSDRELLLTGAAERLRAGGAALAGAVRGAARPRRWPAAVRGLGRLPGALRRELGERSGSSPFDAPLGHARSAAWTSVPLAELKRIEHAAGEGVKVNDVVLAAIGGGIARWEAAGGSPLASVRVKIPVSLHARDEGRASLGNRDSFIFCDLDVPEADPMARLRAISAQTRERKADRDAEELLSFFHAVSKLGPVGRAFQRRSMDPRTFALSVSNVPGPRDPVSVLGHPVASLRTLAEPADRHALRVGAVSLAGSLSMGFCADPAAVGDLGSLADAVAEELRALGAAA